MIDKEINLFSVGDRVKITTRADDPVAELDGVRDMLGTDCPLYLINAEDISVFDDALGIVSEIDDDCNEIYVELDRLVNIGTDCPIVFQPNELLRF